jgi:hypothetical protein
MGRVSQFLEYAKRAKDKLTIKVAQHIYKLKERGYSDIDILHKLYNNYGFIMETGQRSLQLVGANPPRDVYGHALGILDKAEKELGTELDTIDKQYLLRDVRKALTAGMNDKTVGNLVKNFLKHCCKKNPYPHEHAARLMEPKQFKKIRRQNNKFGLGIHAIWGITGKEIYLQAVRFDSSNFTPARAKAWLKKRGVGRPLMFELAKKTQKNPKHRVLPKVGDILEIGKRYLMVTWYGAGQYELRPTNSTGSYVYMLRNQLMNTRYKIVDRG